MVKTRKDILPAPAPEESLEAFVDRLWANSQQYSVNLQEAFRAACEVEEYLRLVRDRASVRATLDLPVILDEVSNQAKGGSLEAARIILDVVGVTGRGRGGTQPVNVLNQINISSDDRKALVEDFDQPVIDVG